jgi:hypothetical protein
MRANKGVRIIKRAERIDASEAEQSTGHEEKTPQELTRTIKAKVEQWVSEHRLRRESERGGDFGQLFADAA